MNDSVGRTIRVLVFGTTGVGKTSLCNIVTQTSTPGTVSDAPLGATFDRQEFSPFDADGDSIMLTDTVGLNENDVGRVPGEAALSKLIDLLKKSEKGYSLLIHVMKHPARITSIDQKNYSPFAIQKAPKLNFQGGLSFGSTVL